MVAVNMVLKLLGAFQDLHPGPSFVCISPLACAEQLVQSLKLAHCLLHELRKHDCLLQVKWKT